MKQSIKYKGYTWTFRGLTRTPSHYRKIEISNGKRNYLLNPLTTNSILASKHYVIPKEHMKIHAFSDKYMKLVEFNSKNNLLSLGKYASYKDKL
jgi:hypothetical protein